MPVMTPDILLDVVEALEAAPGRLVSSVAIMEWCAQNGIDYGPPVNTHFWNSDLVEAVGAHRLLKFKTSPSQRGRNYFARRLGACPAPGTASGHPGRAEARVKRWVECVWNSPWDFLNAKVPPP
jgi:hypothetical protein